MIFGGMVAKNIRYPGQRLVPRGFRGSSTENMQEKISEILRQMKRAPRGTIKELREVQNVTLDELQDRTKVSLQYIIALENNDFQKLPSLVYVRVF